MKAKKVLIIGCGAILNRHLESIESNENYKLVALCDIQEDLVFAKSRELNVLGFTDYKKAIAESGANFVTIATPNSQHFPQSIYCLENGCDILVEKPVSFSSEEVSIISKTAIDNNRKAYCVLQVRLNPTIAIVKECMSKGLLGTIRSVHLTQRWQRPLEYFSGWRNEPDIGGGTLYEVGIHYLDILQKLFGVPEIHSTKVFSTKHKSAKIEDTIYSIMDYGEFGGTCEVTVAAEPQNLECSLEILGSNGYLKIGGKAMNIVESYNFLSVGSKKKFEDILENRQLSIEPNSYGSYQGSCPNHPFVYENLHLFNIEEAHGAIKTIENIYDKAGIKYGTNL